MAIAEVELLYAVVYLLLTHDRQRLAVRRVQPAVHERRVVVVESKTLSHIMHKNFFLHVLVRWTWSSVMNGYDLF